MNLGLQHYLQQQIIILDQRLLRFTHDRGGREYPTRLVFDRLDDYIDKFIKKQSNNKMVIMPGFRGVGKTTLMAQLCSKYKAKNYKTLFLSIEEVRNLFDVGITEIISAYEEILGNNLENIEEPILIFFDEIQSDPKWAISLKSLFERTRNIFFCCTGSAAIILQTTSDLARRAVFEKIPPMSFTEYQMVKHGIAIAKQLNNNIKENLYFSENIDYAYGGLLELQGRVNQYWSNANRLDIRTYLSYGSLPFAFDINNETAVYDAILLLVDKIIKSDLSSLGSFDNNTLNAAKRFLFAIAESDITSFAKLEEKFNFSRHTIASIFEAFEKAELLIKIPAYGSNMGIAKKPSKYLFSSSAIRMAFFYITGIQDTYFIRQGKLLEDSVGAHLYREFIAKGQGAIRYDSEEGGADFILQIMNNKQLIIEVGFGDKNAKQIIKSAKKISSNYNIVFSNTVLKLDKDNKILFVPLDYYFLI